MKIHISSETKLLLDTLGNFRTEHRGLIELKFRGLVDTYWLLGKEGGITHRDGYDPDQEYDANAGPEYMKELTESQAGIGAPKSIKNLPSMAKNAMLDDLV